MTLSRWANLIDFGRGAVMYSLAFAAVLLGLLMWSSPATVWYVLTGGLQ